MEFNPGFNITFRIAVAAYTGAFVNNYDFGSRAVSDSFCQDAAKETGSNDEVIADNLLYLQPAS